MEIVDVCLAGSPLIMIFWQDIENEEDAQKILTELKRLKITGESLSVLGRLKAEGLLQIIEVSLKKIKLGFFSAAEGNSFRIQWLECLG